MKIMEQNNKFDLSGLYTKLNEGEQQIINGKFMTLEEARDKLKQKYATVLLSEK